MRDRKKIRDFFDNLSEKWDLMDRKDQNSIIEIFNTLNLNQDQKILDVGCGTGILFDYYLKTNPKEVVAVDISKKMTAIAKLKYKSFDKIRVLNMDVFDLNEGDFDLIMLYNSYPHIIERQSFAKKCITLLREKGFVVIAHGSGRQEINSVHAGHDTDISTKLNDPLEEIKIWEKNFNVIKLIDRDDIYLIILQLK